MENEFTEVMLSKMNFIEFKNDIRFEFYDATKGNDLGEVICRNIFTFSLHTTLEPNEESLPCLVLDVTSEKLEGDSIKMNFKKLNYGYSSSDGPAVPKSNAYYLFKIEGGPIDISVLCNNIEINRL